jgi:TolB protein
MSKFEVKEIVPITDGSSVDLRPQWNVDASSIVFERRTAFGSMLFRLELGAGRSEKAEPLSLCNKGATEVQGRAAFFARDDFAFVSNRSGVPAVWRADLNRGLVEPLTLPAADERDYGPTARTDSGGHFAFFRIIGSGRPHLYVGRLGETHQPLATGRADGDQPWFLPLAERLVFHSRRDGDDGIFERDVGRETSARRLGRGDEATSFVTPFPSPDGRYVAFASASSGVSQIHVMAMDATERQQLTFADAPSCFPAWSPNGDEIVFVEGDPFGAHPTGRLCILRLA